MHPVPRKSVVLVFAILLLLAWGVADPANWWLGLAGSGLAAVGTVQMLGWVPSI
ncbi:MAG: hypothetical protein L3K18_02410 [Thermoplasmata archaeon]|nr:hypothetical protein [Thermoplasmata archaeon]